MKKASSSKDTLRNEYKRSDFPGGFQRGKYAARAATASNIVVLESEIASAFPTSAAVNQALRTILEAAKQVMVHPESDAPTEHPPAASRRTGNR